MGAVSYISRLQQLLERVKTDQMDAIRQAGHMVAAAIESGAIVHAFGSGHSHMIAEEAFFRAGGLAPVNPIFDARLMFFAGALESTMAERQPGYAQGVADRNVFTPKDVAVIISNSGRNAAPVEMAILLRSKGLKLIAITNVQQSKEQPSRHESGKHLFELVDVVIDNCAPVGDAMIRLPGLEQGMGPGSTVAGAAIINSVMIEAALEMACKGLPVPVFRSANLDSSSEENLKTLMMRYADRIQYFASAKGLSNPR